MSQLSNRNTKAFSVKKVSLNRTMYILKKNGIQSDDDQAKVILDFLYLIAKTYSLNTIDKPENT